MRTSERTCSSKRCSTFWRSSSMSWTMSFRSATPRPPRRPAVAKRSLPVVGELHVDAEVGVLQHPHDGLEIVPVLARDADLLALDGGLDLELAALDDLHDLARLLRGDALLQGDGLARGPAQGLLDRAEGQRLQGDVALDQAPLEDVPHGLELALVVGGEDHLLARELDVGARALEVE